MTDQKIVSTRLAAGFDAAIEEFVRGTGTPPLAKLPASVDQVEPRKLVFYCKDCHATVPAVQTKKKFYFRCKVCGSERISYGTLEGVHDHFRLNDEGKPTKGGRW